MNYYNEIDPYAAQWIRNLIAAGHIPAGVVDERSIEDVTPADLIGYTQCHFFAGIAGWSLALRLAGVPDDYPIWTGSCPCQPFSAAGKGDGFADERHLWPIFDWLIEQCEPAIVVGEQVASKDADPWLDLVCADLEGLGFAFGAVAFPSAGVGAPHIRDRTYWGAKRPANGDGGLADACGEGSLPGAHTRVHRGQEGAGPWDGELERHRAVVGVADAEHDGRGGSQADSPESSGDQSQIWIPDGRHPALEGVTVPGPTNGFWNACDWLACRDGTWRPVEPWAFPLAVGLPSRVGRLRAYGNAINPWQAAEFLTSILY